MQVRPAKQRAKQRAPSSCLVCCRVYSGVSTAAAVAAADAVARGRCQQGRRGGASPSPMLVLTRCAVRHRRVAAANRRVGPPRCPPPQWAAHRW
eukprot:362120-Chlamydomonas_euryale.AAC.13